MIHILTDKKLREIRLQCYCLGLQTGRNERKGIIYSAQVSPPWTKLQSQLEEILKGKGE